MPKLRVFSGAELCDLLIKQGFERVRQRGSHVIMRRGQVSFLLRCIANSIAARYAASFVKADFPGRSSNKHTPWQKSPITDNESLIPKRLRRFARLKSSF